MENKHHHVLACRSDGVSIHCDTSKGALDMISDVNKASMVEVGMLVIALTFDDDFQVIEYLTAPGLC